MRFIQRSSEAEMIAEFLKQEYASTERYGTRIEECLRAEAARATLITAPDIHDVGQNDVRRRVLCRYRGYGSGQPSYFTDFPTEGVDWWWVGLAPNQLLDCRYIRYAFWTELSAGTRSPRDAARRIRDGHVPANGAMEGPREGFLTLADRLRGGLSVPPLILVSADGGVTRVVLEGHARITAYALAPESIPEESVALLGLSPAIRDWDEY